MVIKDFSNREINSLYVHQGIYQDATTGPSNVLLRAEDVINGLYVIESNGGSLISPTGANICHDIPENVRRNDITFRFTIVNNHNTNVTFEANTGITFHPSSPMTLHSNKSYEIIFRVIDVTQNLVDVYRIGYT